MAYNPIDTLARNISTAGTALRLPEMNISERLQGIQASPVSYSTPTYLGVSRAQTPTQVLGSQAPANLDQGLGQYGPNVPTARTGGTAGPAPVQTTQPTGGPTPPTPQGPSGEEIDSVYNPSMQYLDQAEGQLRGDYSNVLSQADRDFQVLSNQLAGNKDTNLSTIQENEVKAGQVKDDALSAARRLYDELRRGYQQRFGGSTSAGQAASEISSVEQQRQMGQTQRTYGDTVRQIEGQRMQVQKDYQDGVFKLEQNKQSALGQAQRDFQNKLLEISNNRTQIQSAKASAKLEALQQLRNNAYQIQKEAYDFQRALDQQKQQSELELQAYYGKMTAQGDASNYTVRDAGFDTNPDSNLQTGSTQAPATQDLAGRVTTPNRRLDEYGNPIQN